MLLQKEARKGNSSSCIASNYDPRKHDYGFSANICRKAIDYTGRDDYPSLTLAYHYQRLNFELS